MYKSVGRAAWSSRIPAARHPRLPPGVKVQLRSFSVAHEPQQSSSSSSLHDTRAPVPSRERVIPVRNPNDIGDLEHHLNSLFPPLKFPPELAARVLTHASHPEAIFRSSNRLSFIGRRVLQTYLHLFISGSPALEPEHDFGLIAVRAVNPYVLGEYVAPKWALGRVLRWTPVAGQLAGSEAAKDEDARGILERFGPDRSRSVGLYKVMGTTVEALVGAVYHQFGGAVAHRFFHTRILPNILLPGNPEGLNDAFHQHAMEVCAKMGGPNGPLLVSQRKTSPP
ncbi:hypothetical protein WOLCODRAFT_140571 [Wolfiporia cocos MD-104 SS10]|uniref:RNase III domain-containing protein n=1 Tax=Wolfiporia cocos (strain MD-104) TaxID=742152 RepID=A0A2H3J3D3_WOLCO|nr:hypothetical protein WOLCODRAFT_140571 [Wolfiporia cocos MD-104 SS10]